MALDYTGIMICPDNCSVGGKAFKFNYFYLPGGQFIVQVGTGMLITDGINSIQVHGWNEEPNTSLNGRFFIAELPHTGGLVQLPIVSEWISIFAKNPYTSNHFDGVCFQTTGNLIKLLGFS